MVFIFGYFRWKDAVESSSFEKLQKLFEFVVKFKDPEVKDTYEDIKPLTKWITPNDMSDALFEVGIIGSNPEKCNLSEEIF